nr:hypothetical protein [Saccharopolyspora spinosa]
MGVEVAGVFLEDLLRVASVEGQHSVGAFFANGAYESFRVWVAVGVAWRDFRDRDVFAGEDCVEGGGELRVAVADVVRECGGVVAGLPQQLRGVLSGPGGGGVGGGAEDVKGAGVDFHDGQGVLPLEPDGVDVEEVRGEKSVCLGFEECGPFVVRCLSALSGMEPGGWQDAAGGGCADFVSQSA